VEDGSPKPPNQAEAAGLSLKAALIRNADPDSDANLSVDADGSVIISGGTLTFSNASPSTVEIPPGVTLKVANNGILDVPDSVTLRVKGTVENSGTIAVGDTGSYEIVPGAVINNTGAINVSGTYTIIAGAGGSNTGVVTVKDGGTIISNAPISGNGTNTVEAGGTVYFAADDSGDPIIGKAADNAIFQPEAASGATPAGKFSYGNGFYAVEAGVVTLGANYDLDTNGVTLTIKAGAKLSIPASKTLKLKNTKTSTKLFTLKGIAGALVEVANNGVIICESDGLAEWPLETISNFYANTGAVESGTPAANNLTYTNSSGSAKVYTWYDDVDENAGNGLTPGWRLP
jgi:hypothetical protein